MIIIIKKLLRALLYLLDYEVNKVSVYDNDHLAGRKKSAPELNSPPVDIVWPLPRGNTALSDGDIRKKFAEYELWHYAYSFEGGLSFKIRHLTPDPLIDDVERHAQRFRHIMPYLLHACGGSLKGKRVLDIACNSGFWAIQCALLGAEVVGFDARPELVGQADLIKSIVGITNVDFRVLDINDMNPCSLGGTFDVVLNMGVLFHQPDPVGLLQMSKAMSHSHLLLDTAIFASKNPVVKLKWEEPVDTWTTARAGIVAYPSKRSIEMMLMHIGVSEWFEIPIRSRDIPRDYREHRHASWLIHV